MHKRSTIALNSVIGWTVPPDKCLAVGDNACPLSLIQFSSHSVVLQSTFEPMEHTISTLAICKSDVR